MKLLFIVRREAGQKSVQSRRLTISDCLVSDSFLNRPHVTGDQDMRAVLNSDVFARYLDKKMDMLSDMSLRYNAISKLTFEPSELGVNKTFQVHTNVSRGVLKAFATFEPLSLSQDISSIMEQIEDGGIVDANEEVQIGQPQAVAVTSWGASGYY